MEVVLIDDYKVDDGRYANNGWLQEMPHPITKMTWDNAVLMSPKTARALGVNARRSTVSTTALFAEGDYADKRHGGDRGPRRHARSRVRRCSRPATRTTR